MKQIEVQIMGQGYLLSCPESGTAQLLDAVSRVDAAMCKIRDAGKVKARDRIAVLASLNLAFELSELQAQHQETLAQTALTPLAHTEVATDADGPGSQQLADLSRRLDQALQADGRLL